MKLLEHEGKRLFRQYGIKVPDGRVCERPDQAARCLEGLSMPVIVKAQVLTGGRGKAGGVVTAMTKDEAVSSADDIFNIQIKGMPVRSLLIEEMIRPVRTEVYLAITIDPSRNSIVLMASSSGGMDIENVSSQSLDYWPLSPFIGVRDPLVRGVASLFGLDHTHDAELGSVIKGMWRLFLENDCDLVEINPLLITESGEMVAADAKVVLNDDAAFRQPGFRSLADRERTELELRAREKGLTLVQLEGDISVIANGAGLTMAVLDLLELNGMRGGVFIDLGGTDEPEKIADAVELAASEGQSLPVAVLVCVFGGITRCDIVAEGILRSMPKLNGIPLVARIRGVNEEQATELLKGAAISVERDIERAVHELKEALVR